MRKGILLLFVGVLITVTAQAQTQITGQDTVRISLQEAINTALKNNYQLKQAENNLSLAQQQILGAKANFLPSVSGNLRAQTTKGQQFNNTTLSLENAVRNSISGGLSGNLTIFQGFTNIMNLRRSNVNEDYQKASESRTQETVIFNAASGFLQVVLNQQLLNIAQENLVSAQEQLKQVKAQVDVGSRPTVDLYNQQSTVASDELTVTQRENNLSYSKTQLIGTLQLDPQKEYAFDAPDLEDLNPTPQNLSLSNLIDQALANRNDLQAQKLLIKRNHDDLQLARANYFPTISANFGINSDYFDTYRIATQNGRTTVNFNDQFFTQNVNKYIGLSINVPIFNNLNTRLNVESSQINYKNSKLQYQNLKYSVLQEVRQAYNDYQSYAKQLTSTQKALQAAEKSYQTQKERYQVGAGTLVELSNANAQYVQAQSERAQAILQFMFQQKLLNYYLGKLDKNIELQ
ncbi:MAG TPA: TolC family protein [Balneolaceae bacterium]|nr:TolC family protein [Balneolaceae bacterium]